MNNPDRSAERPAPTLDRREPGAALHPMLRGQAIGIARVIYPVAQFDGHPSTRILDRIVAGLRRGRPGNHAIHEGATMPPTDDSDAPAALGLVGISEIHDLVLKIGREWVRELTCRDDFPEPAAVLIGGDVWLRQEIEDWLDEHSDTLTGLLG